MTLAVDDDGVRRVALKSATPGASTGYRLRGDDSANGWKLYTGPVALPAGAALAATATGSDLHKSLIEK